jgi:hypothetical protein
MPTFAPSPRALYLLASLPSDRLKGRKTPTNLTIPKNSTGAGGGLSPSLHSKGKLSRMKRSGAKKRRWQATG